MDVCIRPLFCLPAGLSSSKRGRVQSHAEGVLEAPFRWTWLTMRGEGPFQQKPMRILMLSDHETCGGAAVSASRLAEALAEQHHILRCVLDPDGQAHPWNTFSLKENSRQRKASTEDRLSQVVRRFRPHVINVHNIHGGWDRDWGPDLIDACATHAPTVWTLHDMWSFTGRCVYAYDCRAFETGCTAACPTHQEYPPLEAEKIAPAWAQRRDILGRHVNLRGVAPSRWLADEASRGLWKLRCVETIPYGVPLDTFRPIDRTEARQRLGFPVEGPLVLVVAQTLTERRKGGDILAQVWPHVSLRPITLVLMGEGTVVLTDQELTVHALGWIDEPEKQALVYSAADVLLHPAPVDNLPNVVLEAIACGTPVVGFPISGVPEMVRPGISGWLAGAVEARALGLALQHALMEIQAGVTLRESCRDVARREYGQGLQARRYEALFEAMREGEGQLDA